MNEKVHVLLAVWGEKFIDDFLQYSLLSLLSPGNIPALAKTYPTTFVILTKHQDVPVFEQNLTFQSLKNICTIEFIAINDLISIRDYSTTLTYAYDRAIKATQDAMIDTYFVLLNADYIFAESAFIGLMKYMAQGFSAICAGNFQVNEPEIKPFLKRYITPDHRISISSRALLKKSFNHFHPVTLSCMIDQDHLHNHRANRFFLRHDRHTLAGKFYLLHVLCIKPEIKDYKVGAFFDYSFVPELCPSLNVGVIDDSDDYLVIEMQAAQHELSNVEFGPFQIKKLVANLAEWTTALHRDNVKHTIYYHTQDLTTEIKNNIKTKMSDFVDQLNHQLVRHKPRPYRGHPYWVGAVNSIKNSKQLVKDEHSPYYFELAQEDYKSKWRRLYHRLLGYPPEVNRFHFRFQEFKKTREAIKQFVQATSPEKVLTLYGASNAEFMCYCGWLKRKLKINQHFNLKNIAKVELMFEALRSQQFERCIFFTKIEDRNKIKLALNLIKSVLKERAEVLIFILNENTDSTTFLYDFPKKFLSTINYFNNTEYIINRIITIHSNFSLLGTMMFKWINMQFNYSKRKRFFFFFLLGIPVTLLTFLRNVLLGKLIRKRGYCTNILLALKEREN